MVCKITFVSCLIMGIWQKYPHFGLLPPYSPLSPSFCHPHMKFDPYSKKCSWTFHKKIVQIVKNMEHFLAIVLRCSILSNVAKFPEISPNIWPIYIGEAIRNIFWLLSSGVGFWVMLQNIPKVALWWAVSKIMHTYIS